MKDITEFQPVVYQSFVNTIHSTPLAASPCHLKSHKEGLVVLWVFWHNLAAGSSQQFLLLNGWGPRGEKQEAESLPEGTAAVLKGTELNMSALAGSV